MTTISVIKKIECPVSASDIKKCVTRVVNAHRTDKHIEVSVTIVDRPEMLEYVEKYLHETGQEAADHPVLSFVQTELEGPFQFPPDGTLHLGEIIISYPHAQADTQSSGKTDTQAVCELAEHATLHLLGIHHG